MWMVLHDNFHVKRNGIEQLNRFLYEIILLQILYVFPNFFYHTSITMSVSKEIAATILRIVIDVFRTVIQE